LMQGGTDCSAGRIYGGEPKSWVKSRKSGVEVEL
jgi:hypothetical protein